MAPMAARSRDTSTPRVTSYCWTQWQVVDSSRTPDWTWVPAAVTVVSSGPVVGSAVICGTLRLMPEPVGQRAAPLQLGPITVDPPVVLAPMAGVTDAPFRVLCAEFGGGLYVNQMVTARALVERHPTTWALTRFHPAEPVRSLQLYGTDPGYLAEAVRELVGEGLVDHLDLNFGCPAAKVTRIGGGAALAYNQADPSLPDILVSLPELAASLLAGIRDLHA